MYAEFKDVDISNNGQNVVVSGSSIANDDYVILWVLDALNGTIMNQMNVEVAGSSALASRSYK